MLEATSARLHLDLCDRDQRRVRQHLVGQGQVHQRRILHDQVPQRFFVSESQLDSIINARWQL